jgi:glucose-6-phosphate dehydrogenase assembly protein OpcA
MTTQLKLVSPKDIQSTLDQIWESLETKNVARACLFNLIFYTKKGHRLGYIQKLAQKVIEKFPSRVIFILADKMASSSSLKTEVSILTSSQGSFDVACDYIQIDAEGASCDQIPFLVLPHILPDLPVYLVLAEDPTENDPVSYELEQLADRLIFDSEMASSLPLFAKNLLYHYDKLQHDIADLNWARLESFREMLSTAFYSEEKLAPMRQAQTLSLRYNAQKTPFFCHTKIQALYLEAWLSCQLGWQLHSVTREEDMLKFIYRGSSGPITIELIPEELSHLPPGLVLSLHISTSGGEQFSFERDRSSLHQIVFKHATPSSCDLPSRYIFERAESGHSLIKEICHRGTSEHFIHVLHHLEAIKEMNLC